MRKIISLFLILAMLMVFAACGQEKPAAVPEYTPAFVQTAEPGQKAEPEAEPAEEEKPEETEPADIESELSGTPLKPEIVYADDLFSGSGFAAQQCEMTCVYDFTPVNSEGVEWEVYVLDEAFPDADRYIPQAYESVLRGSGSLSITEGQWIYVYCPCNAFTMLEPPEGCALSRSIAPDKEYAGRISSAPVTGTPITETPAADPASPAVVITKSPTGECIPAGGNNWFIAHADNADKITWQILDTGRNVHSLDEAMKMNPGLELKALDNDTLAVSNVPSSFNGWFVRAYFEGAGEPAVSGCAPVYVGSFLNTYSSVINTYKNNLSTKNAPTVYTSLDQVLTGADVESTGVGVLAAMENEIGYYLIDLNTDGVPELVIGSRNEHSGPIIIDLFTVSNGKPKRILASSDRCLYKLREDNRISITGSNGASNTGDYLLSFNGTGITLVKGVEFLGDDVSSVCYRVSDTDFDNSNDTEISRSEYDQTLEEIHQGENPFQMKQIA